MNSKEWQEYARQYIQRLLEYRKAIDKDGAPKSSCDRNAHARWECCEQHRALAARDLDVTTRAHALSLQYDIPGPSHVDSALKDAGIPSGADWAQAQLGSIAWLEMLALAADITVPRELLTF
jgi:hypothetical protein